MKTYEVINHTADTGIKAYGDTLPELFLNAAYGMRDVMVDPGTVRPVRQLNVQVDGNSVEELLVGWLNDLVYLFDTRGLVPSSFKILELEKQHLMAEVHGEHYDDQVHELRTSIKAVTYHMIAVRKNDGWSATVIFDV
jgi:SHS2 domain-containing protein